jgi:hypothetical protein
MAAPTFDPEAILRTIESWPIEDQVSLAHLILRRANAHAAATQRPSWRQMACMAATGQLPPSDEAVAQWLDQYRSETYG